MEIYGRLDYARILLKDGDFSKSLNRKLHTQFSESNTVSQFFRKC